MTRLVALAETVTMMKDLGELLMYKHRKLILFKLHMTLTYLPPNAFSHLTITRAKVFTIFHNNFYMLRAITVEQFQVKKLFLR